MSESNSYAEVVTSWELVLAAIERNLAEIPQAEIPLQKLQVALKEIRELSAEQAALTAKKQEASKRIQKLILQGRKLSTVLRTLVREHYGNRSEKLAEFNLQPFRGRPRKAPEGEGKPPATPPPTPAQ